MIFGLIFGFAFGFLFGFYFAARAAKKRIERSMQDLSKFFKDSAISPDRG